MRHVFKATQIGWDSKKEGIWFDADLYTREEAEAPAERPDPAQAEAHPRNIDLAKYKIYLYNLLKVLKNHRLSRL